MKGSKVSLGILFFFFVLPSFSQVVDTNFNLPIPIKDADIRAVKIQPDDKILIGGDIRFHENQRVNNLIRLHQDGTLDESFVFVEPSAEPIAQIELLSNGEIVILKGLQISKLSASGDVLGVIDSIGSISAICVQQNDKIIVASGYSIGHPPYYLYRFNSDLTLDSTFRQTNHFDSFISDVVLQDDKIMVVRTFSNVNGIFKNSDLARFNLDGSLDEGFSMETNSLSIGSAIAIQEDGKILFEGKMPTSSEGVFTSSGIVRLNVDGSVDTSFRTPQEVGYVLAKPVSQSSSIFVVSGSYINSTGTYLYRLSADGSLDANFTPVRLRSNHCNACLALTNSEEIILNDTPLGGNEYGLTKFDKNGQLDKDFNPEVGTYGVISFGDYHKGKLVVGGDFVRVGEVVTRNLAKINEDGSVDPNFKVASSLSAYPVMDQQPSEVEVIDDNTMLVALGKKVVKLNEKGEVIEEFAYTRPGFSGPLFFAEKLNLLPNGQIAVATINGIVLLNADGVPDPSFLDPNRNGASSIYDFDVQSTGLLFSSTFTQVNGLTKNGLVRLDYQGAVDPTFDVGSGADNLLTNINVLENDDILVTGRFHQFNGIAARRLVKLFKDGQVDKTFTRNYSTTTPEYYFSFYNTGVNTNFGDGFIISARGFYGYTLGFLHHDGTFNPDYHLPNEITSVEREIFPIVINADSLILLSKFQISDDTNPSFALRLIFNKESGQITATEDVISQNDIKIYPNPATDKVFIEPIHIWVGGTVTITNALGKFIKTQKLTSSTTMVNLEGMDTGLYIMRFTKKDKHQVFRILKL